MNNLGKLFYNPSESIEYIFNHEQRRKVYYIPVIYGIIVGINNAISRYGLFGANILVSNMLVNVITQLFFITITVMAYAFVMTLISNRLGGIASYRMTVEILSFIFYPLCISAILILFINLVVVFNRSLLVYAKTLDQFIRFLKIPFYFWSCYLLLTGNSIINRFSRFKSAISSFGLILIISILLLISKLKSA